MSNWLRRVSVLLKAFHARKETATEFTQVYSHEVGRFCGRSKQLKEISEIYVVSSQTSTVEGNLEITQAISSLPITPEITQLMWNAFGI